MTIDAMPGYGNKTNELAQANARIAELESKLTGAAKQIAELTQANADMEAELAVADETIYQMQQVKENANPTPAPETQTSSQSSSPPEQTAPQEQA